jgi:hypothetical protein
LRVESISALQTVTASKALSVKKVQKVRERLWLSSAAEALTHVSTREKLSKDRPLAAMRDL